jgi:hypothetical protein
MSGWREFLAESDAAMRRDDFHRGISYTADPAATTRDAVAEYVSAFGRFGVGAREVVRAVGRDERGVKRALQSMVEDGEARIELTLTRGPAASRRKVYYAVGHMVDCHAISLDDRLVHEHRRTRAETIKAESRETK